MHIFLSTGEPSGDLHAANLIRALRKRLPDAQFVGYGGPNMARAGARVLYPLVDLAVMWFLRVLLKLPTFIGLVNRAHTYFRTERPDALVLIDYPGFNWAMARRAKLEGIPVIYFVPPQIWAWAGWRIQKVRKYIDLTLCTLPFESKWYADRGVTDTAYVGHPYFDEIDERPLDQDFLAAERARPGRVVALLPGSRTQEVTRNLPDMLRAAARIARRCPDARFVVTCLHERHRELALSILEGAGVPHLPVEVHAARTPEIIRLAEAALAVSGSVGLELMAEALPSVVVYKIRPIDLWIARPFIKARFISLVNLLADAEVMPEYLTTRDVSAEMAGHVVGWLESPAKRAQAASRLAELRSRVARPGATERAAERIAEFLAPRSTLLRGPHGRAVAPPSRETGPTSPRGR